MKVTGTALFDAPREQVWEALNDPAVLVRTIPGCQRLEAIGPDAYTMTLTAGVASIKGLYSGEVRLTEQAPLDTFVLEASGSGTPGTVSASVLVRLSEEDGTDGPRTSLTYDADAAVGGMIAGVGQRMLAGAAKKTAGEFFSAVDDLLTGSTAGAASAAGVPGTAAETDIAAAPARLTSGQDGAAAGTGAGAGKVGAPAGPGRVYEAPGAGAALGSVGAGADFTRGALVGAAAALLGALVGGWLAGRRRGT
jgi:carbon monoxide dehydrogenase subunit G